MRTPATARPHQSKCILLTGGNAAGKSTVWADARTRHQASRGILWVDGDHGYSFGKLTAEDALPVAQALWDDPTHHTLVVEGIRIHNIIFRCFQRGVVPRMLYIAVLRRQAEVTQAHVAARCVKAGKPFRADHWTLRTAEYEGRERHARGVAKLVREAPSSLRQRLGVQEFWVDRDYAVLKDVGAWVDHLVQR